MGAGSGEEKCKQGKSYFKSAPPYFLATLTSKQPTVEDFMLHTRQ